MRAIVILLAVSLWLQSAQSYAETFLNDAALLSQQPEFSQEIAPEAATETREKQEDVAFSFRTGPSSEKDNQIPRYQEFTPTHEAMRDVEEKREANDRLWGAIFSLF
ncbi:hypothetical protein [Photobacterium sp. OFAV2-7]|uniref:hypothetical protein n=1 Tax=Photobacterium sp. OFAV2-7 TaxID=2917748 RepID=UPI001EF52B08|nr:hypothetical protein [Photobacterium sp. OFAV2-7]MCG7586106.1 hypothetical protein [Photobacterium sp. OFAV2-7]